MYTDFWLTLQPDFNLSSRWYKNYRKPLTCDISSGQSSTSLSRYKYVAKRQPDTHEYAYLFDNSTQIEEKYYKIWNNNNWIIIIVIKLYHNKIHVPTWNGPLGKHTIRVYTVHTLLFTTITEPILQFINRIYHTSCSLDNIPPMTNKTYFSTLEQIVYKN